MAPRIMVLLLVAMQGLVGSQAFSDEQSELSSSVPRLRQYLLTGGYRHSTKASGFKRFDLEGAFPGYSSTALVDGVIHLFEAEPAGHQQEAVRSHALIALAEFDRKLTTPFITSVVLNKSYTIETRGDALAAMPQDENTAEVVRQILRDAGDSAMHQDAIVCLRVVGTEADVPLVEQYRLSHPDRTAAELADLVIEGIRARSSPNSKRDPDRPKDTDDKGSSHPGGTPPSGNDPRNPKVNGTGIHGGRPLSGSSDSAEAHYFSWVAGALAIALAIFMISVARRKRA